MPESGYNNSVQSTGSTDIVLAQQRSNLAPNYVRECSGELIQWQTARYETISLGDAAIDYTHQSTTQKPSMRSSNSRWRGVAILCWS